MEDERQKMKTRKGRGSLNTKNEVGGSKARRMGVGGGGGVNRGTVWGGVVGASLWSNFVH